MLYTEINRFQINQITLSKKRMDMMQQKSKQIYCDYLATRILRTSDPQVLQQTSK